VAEKSFRLLWLGVGDKAVELIAARIAVWFRPPFTLQKRPPGRTLFPVEVPDVQYARSGDVNIAYQVTGPGLRFRERGSAELKGVAEEWRLYAVERTP
jgi:hypothetical protein